MLAGGDTEVRRYGGTWFSMVDPSSIVPSSYMEAFSKPPHHV